MSQEARIVTDVVSSFEAAQILECSSDNVRRLAREGRLRAVISTRAGRLFSREDVEKLAQERQRSRAVEPTAHKVTQAYIDRIAAYDKRGPYLNSLISVSQHALAEADGLDATLRATRRLTGPLHGIPVIVKDNLDTFNLPTSSGVELFKDFVPPKDAFIVARLRSSGAIILAKSSLSELAMGLADSINSVLPGFTRNPYNTAYASGGSSGGTGVAIAANFGTVGAYQLAVRRAGEDWQLFAARVE